MKLKAEYDPKAKALYIINKDNEKEKFGTTIEKPMSCIFAMDLTQGGEVLGYEFVEVELEILDESHSSSST